jgi:hypothetical protein
VVEGERPLPPLGLLLSRLEEDDEEEDSLRCLRAFFNFFAFFFGTFDLDLDERAALLAGTTADLSSLATPSDSESEDDSEPPFATAAAADAPGAVDAAAAADEVPGLITTPSASYWIRGTSGSSSVGPSVAASVASCS